MFFFCFFFVEICAYLRSIIGISSEVKSSGIGTHNMQLCKSFFKKNINHKKQQIRIFLKINHLVN